MDPLNMSSYVALARASFDQANWKEIATLKKTDGYQTDIGNALESLLEVARRDEENQMGLPAPDYYGPTVRLCNFISLAIFGALKDSRPADERDVACIFASNANCDPPGDMLKLRCRPNYLGFFGARDELVFATGQPTYSRMVSWSEIGLVGEQKKRTASGRGQLRSYMTASKRYRPDLPTVLGFVVHRGKIQLSQLNVAGIWSSSAAPIGDINSWIALVVLLYQSHEHRDRKLVYDTQQGEFPRWDFTDSTAGADAASQPDSLVLVPFYAAPAPGRATYACYQVASGPVSYAEAVEAFYTGEVKGFWKTSWHEQGSEDRSNERQLLDRLHSNGWLPGLVRPYSETHGHRLQIPSPSDIIQRAQDAASKKAQEPEPGEAAVADEQGVPAGAESIDAKLHDRDEDSDSSSGYTSGYDEDEDVSNAEHEGPDAFLTSMPAIPPPVVTREQEIIHLGSIGEPLSQCSTPRELLEAIYDLLQVHIHLWDEGVLHRDVSWFNVLVKPLHYIGNGDKMKPQPCIRSVLHGLGPADNASNIGSEAELLPTILLTDLDHAIEKDHLTSNSNDGRGQIVGTPMFISSELGNHKARLYGSLSHPDLVVLRQQLTLVDEHDGASEALRRAFPDDEGQFMRVFDQVAERDVARREYAPLTERPVHQPRHDAESIYWVFLWALARARPRGSAPETDEMRLEGLTLLARCQLRHEVGCEKLRSRFIRSTHLLEDLLHPDLAHFEPLLRAMAMYLSISWHIYPEVNDNHVHVAFRRMILGHLLSRDAQTLAALGIALDTETPRRVDLGEETMVERTSEGTGPDSLSSVDGILEVVPPPQERLNGNRPHDVVHADSAPPSSSLPGLIPPTVQDRPQSAASASRKRRLVDPTVEPARKRLKTTHDVSPSKIPRTSSTQDDCARKATKYQQDFHFDSRSAHALRLKVWKDRSLWFPRAERV